MSEIRDLSLAPEGEKKIAWAWRNMPVLRGIAEQFTREKPLAGLRVALSVHMEAKTACLCRVFEAAGAEMRVTGCNPLSTQDDVAAALAAGGMDVHALHGATTEEYERHLLAVLEAGPNIVIDDGGDLTKLLHEKLPHLIPGVIGISEETTTGIYRLRNLARAGELKIPAVMVNEARSKYLFDNRYGTGQSVWDGINRTTNLIVAGKTVVIAGYGWCGKGAALRAKGFGARVIVTEIDPVKAIEAQMDGFSVMPMDAAAALGDLFVTLTGCRDVLTARHFSKMRDGAIMCNAGHFNVEINLPELENACVKRFPARHNIEGYTMPDGRELFVIAEGRLVNLASGDGHPAEIMDMSFSIQALCAQYLAQHEKLPPDVYPVPEEIDLDVARRKLAALGASIDRLTPEQKTYLGL
ncbi:MAG: adenosylhomocysteinase [Oscillospiraceae bacterium]|jgi:adenosylhomocysteinase|nr:adenosylhomocysteinase [Oscillospiraceae bacterium]